MNEHILDAEHLKTWIGKSETVTDTIDAGTARRMQAVLDHEPDLENGDPLPPLWHWCYFHPQVRHSMLGPDGHPARGGFMPPVPLPRRMWAGGRLVFAGPLIVGSAVRKISTIRSVDIKEGKSGTLCFVVVRHEFEDSEGASLLGEEQDIVYREPPKAGAVAPEPPPAPRDTEWNRNITPDPVQLFRYSALTFNSHRIHYDVDYCRGVEGYPGLVVHGPLTATLLCELALENNPGKNLAAFDFRAVSPLFDTAGFKISGKPGKTPGSAEFWASNPQGALAMKASVRLAG